jgi:hypothetical protein
MTVPSPRPSGHPEYDQEQQEALEVLAARAYGEDSVTEVIRPAAVLPEMSAREVLFALSMLDARDGGEWISEPASWSLYDQAWTSPNEQGPAQLIGTMHVAYGTPTRYEITIFRATVTAFGMAQGWDVVSLCDRALVHAGLSLASCPRAQLSPPPRPFRMS